MIVEQHAKLSVDFVPGKKLNGVDSMQP